MGTAKCILAEFMTVVMVLQACSPTVAAVAAGWQNISSEIAAASAEASDAAESGETKSDAATGSGSSDTGADSDSAGDDAAKDDAAAGDNTDSATGSDSTGDQAEGDDAAGDTAADDAERDADDAASEDAAAQADTTITDLNELIELLKANGAESESIVLTDDGSGNQRIKSLNVKSSEAFTVLSNADASLYYDAQIKSIITGDAKLTSKADNDRLSFQGFGSDEHPFEGKIYSSLNGVDSPVELTADRTVFNKLKLTDQNNTVKIKWMGATAYSAPMVASKISGEGKTLSATVDIAGPLNANGADAASALTAPLLGETTGDLTVNVTYGPTGSRKNLNVSATGNVGLLANTVKSGTFAVESIAFPDNLATDGIVKTSSGNAGLLVGEVEDGATLSVSTSAEVPAATVQSESGSAGGVVGLVGSNTGATVNVTEALDLQKLTVKGTTASGGLIGKATKLTLGADNKKFTCPVTVGDANSACSGGVIGDVSFAQGFTVKPNMFDFGDGVTLGAWQRAGALFGMADITNGDIVVQGGTYKSALTSGVDDSARRGSYGGLVGKVFATAMGENEALRAFVVQKDPDQQDANKNKCTIEFKLASTLYYAGGVVGYVGDGELRGSKSVAVVLNGVEVACKGDASARIYDGKLGGAVGVVDTRDVLDVRDFKLTSENPIGKAQSNRAAGIAGSAWNAVIKFSGITDLSGASFAENGTIGQLVYENYNALIFAAGDGSNGKLTDKGATGWTFKRSKTASKTDDIATYGEVIRLGKDFIKLDPDTHVLTLPDSLTTTNDAYVLNTVEDFAKLAITWQTNGYYSMVDGVSENKLNGLQSSTITVNGTIDLAGTGLTGFTQDRASDSQVFSGTLNGSGTINLAVGEPYGKRDGKVPDSSDTSDGSGNIYRHGRLGLFAAVNGANISNVTIAGSMKFDNGSAIDAGSLAGTIAGNLTLSGATSETNITCDDTFGNDVNIGGIAGGVSAAATVDFNGNTKAKATIATGNTLNGNTRIGGAIGYVGDVVSTFNVASLKVGGSINTGDCTDGKIAQVGGLIGCIVQGDATSGAKKNVVITGLGFNGFKMTVGKNGDKLNGAGGLLGYSWGNAIVTIGDATVNTSDGAYALKTSNNTTVTANSSTEVGGLVYAASGYWIINDYAIDLSDATINADKATVLGLLVGRGGRTENSSTYGAETYSGLYLENRASWDTAYKVSGAAAGNGVKINNTAIKSNNSATSFDEWVGNSRRPSYGTKAGSKLIDGEWNVVVSLHTKDGVNNGKLDMSGKPESDNSYHNRSDFGKDHNTNAWTRYYYNLDKAYAKAGNNSKNSSASSWMDSPEYLLLWCAYLYAPSAIRAYIIPGNQAIFKGNNIGTSDSAGVAINLDGYSFYPTNPVSGSTVTVNNATITFHYADIKAEQEGNKKNSEATQHENMHCALIRTHTGDLKVKNVTLAGTVGSVVNDAGSSSGALVCRYIYGPINKTKVAQLEIDGLTLDGLTVDGVNVNTSYAPLLVNEMQTCVNLNANNISTRGYSNGTTAATSLFGRLGVGKNADQVTVTFNRIGVPSATGQDATNRSIFTHASLLESFGYGEGKTGSAVYTFLEDDQGKNKVTFGKEIDSTDSEYYGNQLWYYDEDTYMSTAGLVSVGGKTAGSDQFGGYLPYVAKGKATENGVQYHEIKVNQRIPNFVTGCGTYGDPYVITSASELNAAANYINNGTALDGWEVTIAKDQSTLCQRRNGGSTENEVTYVYKQTNDATKKWEKKTDDTTNPNDALSDDTMRRYLQSAYYSIEPKSDANNTIELDGSAFAGFGTSAYPFRGVIVGDLGNATATIAIKNNTGSLRGLIPYSYGSVVRNLNITYSGAAASIAYASKNSDGVPGAFFGGVIGCIMGGDNIIDGVTVNASDGFSVTASGSKAHLVPIGGYVGAIAGGGVIFRNSSKVSGALNAWHDKGTSLYDNPYVGRVIDGYAFSEGEGCVVDNGDDNYKINKLDVSDTGCVTTTDTYMKYSWSAGQQNNNAPQTTVKDSQGLLVLSAIINSGAGAGAAHTDEVNDNGTYRGSHAYEGSGVKGAISSTGYKFGNGRYGKVRNAEYTAVGKPADAAAESDFQTSTNDDLKAPGNQEYQGALDSQDGQDVNSPYLVKKYATDWRTGYVCAMGICGMDLKFEQGMIYDLTGYGSGFLGLSGRYYSNACATDKKVNDKDLITPGIATINGNGATIKVSNNTREYVDDDYNIAGVGGLFSTIKFYSGAYNKGSIEANDNANVSSLNFKNCNISLAYVSSSGVEQSASTSNKNSGWVGVGCLAGSTANQGASDGAAYGVFKSVAVSNSTVAGGCMAGGLIGSAGLMTRSTDGSNGSIVNYGGTSSPVKLYDCSYSGITVSARSNAGGFVGYINSGDCGVWVSNDKAVANSSTISIIEKAGDTLDWNCAAGGIFGLTGGALSVNTGQGDGASQVATISDVSLVVNHSVSGKPAALGVGGIAGRTVTYDSNVNRVKVTSTKKASEDRPTYFGSLGAASDTSNTHAISTGGIIGSTKNKVTLSSCTVEKLRMGVTEHAGGLVGATTDGNTLSATNVTVDDVQFDGARCGGILGNCQDQGGTNVVVSNATVKNCSFGALNSVWQHEDGLYRNHSGGIVGAASGTIKIANVLISKNDFRQPGGQGFLLGDTAQAASNYKGLYAAGVDIVLKDGSDSSSTPKPIKYFNSSAVADVNKKSYIAFGVYGNTLPKSPDGKTRKTLYGCDSGTTTAVSPYVTTSPMSDLAVRTSDTDTTDRYLFGDGMNVKLAENIEDRAKVDVDSRYIYTNIGGINEEDGAYQKKSSYDASSVASMFNANNDAGGNQVATDFPVLVISGSDNTTVTSYLNIITNGGFSDACRLNNENGTNPHVTAKAEVFQLKGGVFVRDDEASNNPTLRVVNNGKKNMSFSPSSDWDNGKGRFTLLTVTFTEAGQSYNVQVPIIVKRKLEIDFTATYDYGTNFKESNYTKLGVDAHVLTSFGEPMTGLLTWTYNSANGNEVDFGWDSYMAAGGSMRGLGKSILFNGADGRLPQGTQLTLVDANVDGKAGGREYHYEVGEGGATSVSLSGDAGFKDSADKPYQERWLSKILDVSAKQDNDGAWVVCDNDADATAKAKLDGTWTLFKVADADAPSDKRYTLTVPKDKNGNEQRASESVYLVVNVPEPAAGGTQTNINGFTATSIDSNSSGSRISWNLHHVLRDGSDDNQNGTASTYSILSNYEQVVVDKKDRVRTPVSKSEDSAAYVLSLDVVDTVTFSPSQYYTENDQLFYQLDTSLCKYGANNTLTGVSSFPSGTSAIAKFYVAIGNQNYTWNGSDWETCDASTPAFTQIVTDTGNDSLKLTLDHDLAGIRRLATGGIFTVRTVVDEIRLTPDGCNKVIALSQQSGEDAYTMMSYTAKLSTRDTSLATSSLAVTTRGNVGYYRMDTGDTTITLSAPEKSQLGINVDDLRPIANGTIGLGATYELGGLNNAAEAIKNAGSVVYTLTLQRRDGINGSYEDVTGNISDYVTVTESKLAVVNAASNAITFTDSTRENGKFKTQNGDTTFNLPFTVKVNTQVEQSSQFYANYRLVMTASLVKDSAPSAAPRSPDYVTYTLTRVNLNGIDH